MNTKWFFRVFSKESHITLTVNGIVQHFDEQQFNEIRQTYRLLGDHQEYRTESYCVVKATDVNINPYAV